LALTSGARSTRHPPHNCCFSHLSDHRTVLALMAANKPKDLTAVWRDIEAQVVWLQHEIAQVGGR
jgi:hypothetical protein